MVGYRQWAENPCDCGHAEGCIIDDGDPETYLYVCWDERTTRVARDDPEVLEAIAGAAV